jgi:transforming growth factor-beta-induced protein
VNACSTQEKRSEKVTLRFKSVVPFLVALVLIASAIVPVSAQPPPFETIVDVVLEINAETGEFSILIEALQAADPKVLEFLAALGQRTVFAPTDAAFLATLDELGLTAEELLASPDLTKILLYHVTWGRLYAEEVLAKDRILMLQGGFLLQDGGVLTDNLGRQANIIQTDVEADNGIIHVIDNVVLPNGKTTSRTIVDVVLEINAETGEFSILIEALQAAHPKVLEFLAARGQRTVFAPTDAAFLATFAELGIDPAALLADQETLTKILLYHVTWGRLYAEEVLAKERIRMLWGGFLLQDGGVLTDNLGRHANIIQVDVEADNGIIHVIDNVVLPNGGVTGRTIVDVVLEINAETGEFSTLIAALQAADPKVLEFLAARGQRTVFAPTDAAFAAAFAELGIDPADLLADQETLTKILLYHVTWGRLYAEEVLAMDSIRMLWGGFLWQDGGVLTDNLGRQATIIQTDVEADNGIIHVIDNVVLPGW